MLERDNNTQILPDYGMKILDHFYPEGTRQEERDYYLSSGLIPTNNLSMYIVDEPKAEWAPGVKNPFDYRWKTFGGVIEKLKTSNPELWEEAKKINEESDVSGQNFIKLLDSKKPIDPEVFSAGDRLQLRKSEIYNKVIRIIAPQLLEQGIDPLDVCI